MSGSRGHGATHAHHRHGVGEPHVHAHAHGPQTHDRAFALGIALNLGFVGVEAWFGLRADSLALLADAGHNLSDVAGLVLAWGGAVAGRLRPDARHTWGWQRASIVAAFVNAVVLLVAMGSLAWEALGRLHAPAPTQGGVVAAVAALGILVNAGTALLFVRGSRRDLNLRGAYLHMAADAAVSAGVVVAGALVMWTGWARVDPVVGLAVAAVIVWGTWSLLRQSLHLMFDGVPEGVALHEVEATLRALPGVAKVHDLHVWATGTTQVALTAHLVMPEGPPDDALLERATRELHARFGIGHVTLQVVRKPFTRACSSLGSPFAPPE